MLEHYDHCAIISLTAAGNARLVHCEGAAVGSPAEAVLEFTQGFSRYAVMRVDLLICTHVHGLELMLASTLGCAAAASSCDGELMSSFARARDTMSGSIPC